MPRSQPPRTINVLKATPNVTWANPAGITYGTALSATQLDATASVPGHLCLCARRRDHPRRPDRRQALSVTFTPADTADYAPVTATANINVLKATPNVTWANPAGITYGTALAPRNSTPLPPSPAPLPTRPGLGPSSRSDRAVLSATFTPADTDGLCPGHSHREHQRSAKPRRTSPGPIRLGSLMARP